MSTEKILHLSFHKGTIGDIRTLMENIEMKIELDDQQMDQKYLSMSKEVADQVWRENGAQYMQYDTILITDTAMLARPFFQHMNEHTLRIIVYVTNRFDWLAHFSNYEEYIQLYKYVHKHYRDRCTFICDNLYDQYCLKQIGDIDAPLVRHYMMNKIEFNKKKNGKLFVYDRGTRVSAYQEELKGIEYDVYNGDYRPYRDREHINEYLCYFHLPYQVNLISLWENLSAGIIYLLPSKALLTKWILGGNWYYWEEKNKSMEFVFKSIDLSEWYQPEFQEYFLFFDSWEELHSLLKSENRDKLEKKLEEKRIHISQYIESHNNKIISQWYSIL